MASRNRFSLICHDKDFFLLDMTNGRECWFGSGIATVVDREGKAVTAARADFVEIVETLLNADVSRTLEEYFTRWSKEPVPVQARNSPAPERIMIRLPRSSRDPILEFRHTQEGSIQRREYEPEEESQMGLESQWQTLSRLEVMHYLNYGGIVGVWLDDLRDQGLIRTRQRRRAVATTRG